jgi:RNA polymerase sigma-70 factor (ECF subfamily)
MRLHDATNEELLGHIADGNADAFAELWGRLGGPIVAIGRRLLDDAAAAEDAAQETFTTIWRAAATFDSERGAALSWIYTIARNAARDVARRRRILPVGEVPEERDTGPQPDEVAAQEMTRFGIHAAVAGLGAKERQVIELAYYEGLSQSEIANRLATPLGTVKTRTRNALATLADQLGAVEEWR